MLPDGELDEFVTKYPTTLPALIEACSGVADSYLRKKYKLPLVTPYPPELVQCVVQLVVYRVYLKRGVKTTTNEVAKQIVELKDAAMQWLDDVSRGLVELEPNADATPDISEGGPVYGSLGSPYSWYDQYGGSSSRYGRWNKCGC